MKKVIIGFVAFLIGFTVMSIILHYLINYGSI
jgi:hypothetical protein